jgi:hypothetical protein
MLKAYYQTSKISVSGKVVRGRKMLSRSFLKQFLQIYGYLNGGPGGNMKRIYGDSVSSTYLSAEEYYTNAYGRMCIQAGEGNVYNNSISLYNGGALTDTNYTNTLRGIVIGSDDTPVSSLDYAHGAGPNKMVYLGMVFDTSIITSNPTSSYGFERMFMNLSGYDIVIKELGIYCLSYRYNTGSSIDFCLVRDVIPPVTVSNNEYFNVRYTLQVSV